MNREKQIDARDAPPGFEAVAAPGRYDLCMDCAFFADRGGDCAKDPDRRCCDWERDDGRTVIFKVRKEKTT